MTSPNVCNLFPRVRYLGIVVLACLGLMSTPVECALAVGPHSIFNPPANAAMTHAMHTSEHHHPGADTGAEEAFASPSASALWARLATLTASGLPCLDTGQDAGTSAPASTVVGVPSDGSAPVSVTSREARLAIGPFIPGLGQSSRMLTSLEIEQPVSDPVVAPELPPPRLASV